MPINLDQPANIEKTQLKLLCSSVSLRRNFRLWEGPMNSTQSVQTLPMRPFDVGVLASHGMGAKFRRAT